MSAAGLTGGTWSVACDSYGKVRHSRKACVYADVATDDTHRLVTVAARIENWNDANVMAASKEMLKALEAINHVPDGYCICPMNDGVAPHEQHSTCCQDARYAVAKAHNRIYATGELLPDAFVRRAHE